MRVLHVLAPASYGGLEQVVSALARGLSRVRVDVHIAAIIGNNINPATHPFLLGLNDARVKLHPVQVAGRAYLRERASLRELCHRLRPDVVHTHGYRADVIAGAVARSQRIPIVATAHGFTGGDFRNRCYESLQRRAFRSFDAVIAVSRPLRDQLTKSARGDRVQLIRNAWSNGVVLLPREHARARLQLSEPGTHIGWIGRLSHEKAPDVLLEALPRIAHSCEVTFIGDGAQRSALERRVAQLGMQDRVHFAGAVDNAGTLLRAFDVFVLSSRTEGTPIVLFEAMAAGVPVVATSVGGVPDVINGDHAVLVPSQNSEALAAAISQTLSDPLAAQVRAQAAQQHLYGSFAVDDWIQKHLLLYHRLADKVEAA